MPSPDDEIIDAEIVEDNPLLPAVFGSTELDLLSEQALVLASLPPGSVLIEMSFQQRQLVRAALAWYHDKGPRERRTSAIMDMMHYMADHEQLQSCATCADTGKYRTMYEMHYCNCPKGMQRRQDRS